MKYFYFLVFIKTSLILAGLMVEDQKGIFQLFLNQHFLARLSSAFSNSPCCMHHLLVSQTCYVSASHRERPANFKTLKKQLSLLGLLKLASDVFICTPPAALDSISPFFKQLMPLSIYLQALQLPLLP